MSFCCPLPPSRVWQGLGQLWVHYLWAPQRFWHYKLGSIQAEVGTACAKLPAPALQMCKAAGASWQ